MKTIPISSKALFFGLEHIYMRRSDLERHVCAPLLRERAQFLTHMVKQGSATTAAQNADDFVLRALPVLKLKRMRVVTNEEIENAIKKLWGHKLSKDHLFPGCRSAYAFRAVVRKWLSFHNCLRIQTRERQLPTRVAQFKSYLASRNLATCTVESDTERALRFLRWLSTRNKSLFALSLNDVDAFITLRKHQGWSITTLRSTAQSLRSFIRFAAAKGWCRRDISCGVRLPSRSFCSPQDQSRKWSEVRRLLKSIQGNHVSDIRARAALLLISTYALRISEMARLKVSDFDFRNMTLRVRRSKNNLLHCFPLEESVAKAVKHYLKVRPKCNEPLFLTIKTPFRPANRKTFYAITNYRFAKLGIRDGKRGPHAIRHAVAMELLRKGTTLRQIGDFLGHKHCESALTYAKFTIQSLRFVAEFNLRAVL
jgi:integrase/recombinase XerD